jgi:DNA-binding response OmpR family regulator
MHLTIIDQNTKILNKYKAYLKPYFRLRTIDIPLTILNFLEKNSTDMLIMGIGNYNKGALELYELIQEKFNGLPAIFLGEKIGEKEIVRALELGAEDVIKFPTTGLELYSRIKNKIQKSQNLKQSIGQNISDKIILNDDFKTILIDKKKYVLTPHEFKILSILSGNMGKIHLTSELEKAIWGQKENCKHSLATHINNLRNKVPELDAMIVNKRGRGYYFDIGNLRKK